MVHAKHILLKVSENDPKEKVDLVIAKANKILKEAQEGAAFEALVQKYSEGSSNKQGGDLGFFGRGQMAKPFEDAAFNAKLWVVKWLFLYCSYSSLSIIFLDISPLE